MTNPSTPNLPTECLLPGVRRDGLTGPRVGPGRSLPGVPEEGTFQLPALPEVPLLDRLRRSDGR